MMNKTKRIAISLLLVMTMVLGLLPGTRVHAAGPYNFAGTGFEAYYEEDLDTPITSADEGDWIVLKPADIPAGKYVASMTSEQADIQRINSTSWRFQMPASDVTVTVAYDDQKPYTIDLTEGSFIPIPAAAVWLYPMGTSGYKDLDGDGTDDFYVKWPEAGDMTITLEAGTNIKGEYVLNVNGAEYSPFTFIFPDEAGTGYTITKEGVFVKIFDESTETETEVSKAEEGTILYVSVDFDQVPEGKYVSDVTSEDVSIERDGPDSWHFEMPAGDVTISAVYADQEPYTIDLTAGGKVDVPKEVMSQLVPLYTDSDFDLDGDGNDDVHLHFDVEEGIVADATRLDTTKITTSYDWECKYSQYNPVIFKFGEEAADYTITKEGVFVKTFDESTETETEVSKAEEGTILYVSIDYDQIPEGKYVSDVTSEDVTVERDGPDAWHFEMPAGDVTISAVYADQEPYTIDLTSGGTVEVPKEVMSQLVPLYADDDIDLDGDGNDDVHLRFVIEEGIVTDATRLGTANIESTYDWECKYSQYNPVIFKFGEEDTSDYSIVSGEDGNWLKDSGAEYEIVVKRSTEDDLCFTDYFKEVHVDGIVLVPDTDYTAKQGSCIVTFKPEYLETLSEGTHTVEIVFTDETVTTELTIAPKEETPEESQTEPDESTPDEPGEEPIDTPPEEPGESEESSKPDTPPTGDGDFAIWWMLLGLSGIALVTLNLRRKENR